MGVKISSIGQYLPCRIMTNHELSNIVDTSDEWIRTRTGICERRIADENECTSTLAIKAAKDALSKCDINPADVELILVATMMPDSPFPSTACKVQNALGAKRAAAFDISAACSGFVYGLETAAQFIKTGYVKNALVIGSEVFSRFLDWEDRSTCVLFGDGAGAAFLEQSNTDNFLGGVLRSDGSGENLLYMEAGGTKLPANMETVKKRQHYLRMNGLELMQTIVPLVCDAILEACQKAGLELDDIDCIVPHQANINIIEEVSEVLEIPIDKFMVNLDKVGNTSSASIPLCLIDSVNQNQIKSGQNVLMAGFGAGLTYAVNIVKWDESFKK